MPTEVVMPQMGESITEGTLTRWLKKVGDTVARGERVGLIKFGSRVDVLFAPEAAIQVKLGTTVHGGSSILAVVPITSGSTQTNPAQQYAAPARGDK